jgi:enoyl-CoA hydratase/carnithine racemase
MTGLRLDAQRSLQLGVINAVYPAVEHLAQTLALGGIIASHAAESQEAIKRVIDEGSDMRWADALDAEARAVARLWGSPAQKRAQAAFFNGRPALPIDKEAP